MEHFLEYINNPNQDLTLSSPIPKSCLKEGVMLGIDEAGRGPVLGPMVYAVAFFPISMSADMKKMDFADSKTLTEAKREQIFKNLGSQGDAENIGWSAKILSPMTISNTSLRRRKYNLNQLSHDTAIGLVRNCLDAGVKVRELYVDTVGPQEKYKAKLRDVFPQIPKITVESKADSKFHVVSAASICAKVIRDRVVEQWKFPENNAGRQVILQDLPRGSGYPGDQPTKDFLKKILDPVFGFPTFVRFCWSTAKVILDDKAINCEFEEDDGTIEPWNDEDDNEPSSPKKKKSVKTAPITNFFKKPLKEQDGQRKKLKVVEEVPVFFLDRHLTRVTSMVDFM